MGAASAAVVCLGGTAVVALGGDDGPAAYVAVGAAGGTPSEPGSGVAPTGKVELVPLDSAEPGDGGAADEGGGGAAGEATDGSGGDGSGTDDGDGGGGMPADGSGSGGSGSAAPDGATDGPSSSAGSGGTNSPGTPSSSAPAQKPGTGSPSPAGPAALKVGDPELKDTDKRWCQDVTLTLHNSGGSAVRSGTVTFGTHVIGALGIDWATVKSTEKLPVPIGPGEKKEKTWTVCVDSWRVPLGMHLETRDVDVDWK
ncbi:hypothetical protein [Streptomyces longispororuber]|uniref:hypothetical protein n=1 Tax=Streptomyces longispororuber TaxID=68230 RepID=UPI00210CD18F|nr:hypothetical protein [Streptomyces longispororuber]MCQ4211880.1 hypothetical protein [Streptomyces longispororuber]